MLLKRKTYSVYWIMAESDCQLHCENREDGCSQSWYDSFLLWKLVSTMIYLSTTRLLPGNDWQSMFVRRNPLFQKAKTDLRNLTIGKTWLLLYCYRREIYIDFFCKFQELESFIDHLTDIPQITIKNTTLPRNPFHRLFPHSNKEQTLIYCDISSCYLRSFML